MQIVERDIRPGQAAVFSKRQFWQELGLHGPCNHLLYGCNLEQLDKEVRRDPGIRCGPMRWHRQGGIKFQRPPIAEYLIGVAWGSPGSAHTTKDNDGTM